MARKEIADVFETSADEEMYFLTKFEKDLQLVFDNLYSKFSTKNKCFHVKNVLKKGSLFHKGDFFLSLRSDYVFFSDDVKIELLDKLDKIPYIHKCEVEEDGNLVISLNRTVLFKDILKTVKKHENQYGMKTSDKSFLILVHNEVFRNFESLRIALIANHVFSFFVANGAKVFANDFRKDAKLEFLDVPSYTCTDDCLQKMESLCELIKHLVQGSDWSSIVDGSESITVNLKKFVLSQSLNYGKDTDNIIISKNFPNIVVNMSAYIAHFQSCHDVAPNHIIHICSQSQRRKIIDSGLLIEMLDLLTIPQIFITCQTTVFKNEPEATVDEFIDFQRKIIEKAMTHKFNCQVLTKKTWDSYVKTLVDTSVKFHFLRAGTNVPLKMDFLSGHKEVTNNKDGIFIQYNFARLSNILRTFEFKVKEGHYLDLPPLDEVDFKLLKFEEEWNLLNFIVTFPRLVEEIFWSINSRHLFPVSKICIMLTKLCSCFSVYYSRIHILGGPQPQLQKVMFVRLWLLKGIHQIMCNSFTLLNIKGLNKM